MGRREVVRRGKAGTRPATVARQVNVCRGTPSTRGRVVAEADPEGRWWEDRSSRLHRPPTRMRRKVEPNIQTLRRSGGWRVHVELPGPPITAGSAPATCTRRSMTTPARLQRDPRRRDRSHRDGVLEASSIPRRPRHHVKAVVTDNGPCYRSRHRQRSRPLGGCRTSRNAIARRSPRVTRGRRCARVNAPPRSPSGHRTTITLMASSK